MAERRVPSPAQRRAWFLEQLEPGQAVSHVAFAARCDGRLDEPALRAALADVAARHDVLRTTFEAHDGEPVAVVGERAQIELTLAPAPCVEPEEAARRCASDELRRPFDALRGPLVRVFLLRCGPESHVLLGVAHALVFDAPSAEAFWHDVGTAYAARVRGEGVASEVALGSAERHDSPPALLDWWREHLRDALPLLELPGDRPRPAEASYRAGRHVFELPLDVARAVRAQAARAGVAPFAVLLAACGVLLARLCGRRDVVVGVPAEPDARAGRIGPLANALPLRLDLSGDPSFLECAARVARAHAETQAHTAPFEQIVDALQPQRSRAFAPLFQHAFALAGAPPAALRLPELTLTPLDGLREATALDLEWELRPSGDTWTCAVTYAADLFDAHTVARFAGHYGTLLAAAVAAPDERVSRLPLLTDDERRTLLVRWNDTGAGAGEACLHELFEAQARATPDAPAVLHGAQALSYAELHARAERWAARLAALGVGPDVPVGIALPRSLDMYVAVLAVLQAGGAYVPLDPEYPRERLAFMLGDAGAPVLLTQRELSGRLPLTQAQVVYVDDDAWQPVETRPRRRAQPGHLAYIVFTSGSTGRPKGVALPHRALASLVAWQQRVLQPEAVRRTAQFASLSFDVSCQEMFTTWAAGGALVLVDEETRRDPRALLRLLRDERVTRLFLPFVALQQLADEAGNDGALPSELREVITAGEQLQATPALRRFFESLPAARLHNHYGPSETHVATAYALGGAPAAWPALPPIGRPIAGAHAYVVDARLEPVPVGVPGELLVSGVGLARGYVARPDLTAERFWPDPFARTAGARAYRTGDLVRWRADGALEFLGRVDQQVKIRGFRVEPGEIEAALACHPRVCDVAVTARAGAGGRGTLLVAYVVPDSPPAPSPQELRAFLSERLADYMVPGAFVTLAALPQTPSGKVDRRALPAPDDGAALAPTGGALRTPLESAVAEVWRDVLGLRAVGVHDDFFALGGHSLVATRLVARLRRLFGVDLPLRVVFETRTLGALAAAVAAAQAQGAPLAPEPMPRAARDRPLPLSFAQQRLWFLDQLRPGLPLYNVSFELRLDGQLDAGALLAALEQVGERHEALRTRFEVVDGEPRQAVGQPALEWTQTDLSGVADSERDVALATLTERETRAPFDLARGPLWRAHLVQLGEERHTLLLTSHHIVSDGWSQSVLLRELAAFYRARVEGRPPLLPALEHQYADFAAWQRAWLQGERLDRQLAYWRARLGGDVPAVELPADRPRPAEPSLRGARVDFGLAPETVERLAALARREGATLFMVLLAAFLALLRRYTGQSDVVVGTPSAGRDRPETEGLIGFFVNTLVLRADLSGDPAFTTLLERVKRETLGAYAHQDVPFERLVAELQPERDLRRNPLFQVVFAAQDVPLEAPEWPGLDVTARELSTGTAKFDLLLSTETRPEGLRGTLEYSTDLFDAARIERLAQHFCRLLDGVAQDASRRVSELPLVSDAERRQVLVEWNPGAADYPREASLAEVFAAQVRATPAAPALECGDERLTYAELDARAEALARRLREHGVGAEVPVGIAAVRALETVVGVLAIVKAGGAYVPLDPAYPRTRLELLIDDAGVESVLDARGDGAGRVWDARAWLGLDARSSHARRASGNPAGPDSLAYVMYTSGTTGRPKGVRVTQRAVVRLVKGQTYARFGASTTLLHFAPLSFDASTFEIWGALLNGGRLVVFAGAEASLEELGASLRRSGVTTLWLTAGLFQQMVEQRLEDLSGVRELLAGGDVLAPATVKRVLEELPGCRVINGYGPTENTTFTCCHVLRAASDVGTTVPIGRAIAHTRVYVLDEWMQSVAPGVPGELYAGGDGLARDYLGRPELTAASFVPDPWSGTPGARLYRSGDVVRWRADGVLEFLGRRDAQVKVRGFRIETGEIEAALRAHPSVGAAVVSVRGDAAADKRLIAYVVAQAGASLRAEELRAFLSSRLPESMLPSAYVTLAELPLTANGKVDRRALPEPQATAVPEEQAPHTPTEEILAGIWAQVLGLERVGREQSFFDLGGHSLLATQVVSRVRQALGVELPLRALFEAPTVAGLAGRVAALQHEQPPAPPPITRVPRDGARPLSFAQQRLWFFDQLLPGSALYNVPAPLRLDGPLDVAALRGALRALVARHEGLRTTFPAVDGQPHQIVADEVTADLDVIDLGHVPASEREAEALRLAEQDARRPFDLARGPLLRVALVRLDDACHVLLLTLHHIVSDGWSMDVLLHELAALYAAATQGRPAGLPELPVQYADFAHWQRQWLQGDVLERQLAYWRARLSDGPPPLELPADRPRPPAESFRGALETFTLPADTLRSLEGLARREGATLFMALLAAFDGLLQRYTGQTDIVVGTPVAGRNRAELEGLVGFFVNTVVLRTDVGGDPTFGELLARVRREALGAYAHQDVPFERLVEELHPRRDPSRHPLFQVLFVLRTAPFGALDLPGLGARLLEVDGGTAKFDLTLALERDGDGLRGALEYNVDLFERERMRRFARHYRALTESWARAPRQRLSQVELLAADERRVLLEARATPARGPAAVRGCLHELFAEQARRTPEALALVCEDARLTYGELDRRANRLAHHLRRRGVAPDELVGLYMERSAELVVGLLGILKSGAAYLPLEPAYPRERLAFMLEDARARVVLTQQRLLDTLPAGAAEVLSLDGEAARFAHEAEHDPEPVNVPEHLAYVIYTSGSTGRPKGVMVTHANVARLFSATEEWFVFGPNDAWSLFHSHAFDFSVWELWGALLHGGRVVIVPYWVSRSPEATYELLVKEGVTVLSQTPSAFRQLAQVEETRGPAAELKLREVVFGGEALELGSLRAWWERHGDQRPRLVNMYGITETTVHVTYAPLRAEHAAQPASLIGRGIPDLHVYVLDRHMNLLPEGVPGELCIGGAGLARGYLRRPELTAERFVPDLYGAGGGRLYRSGDLGRWRADGTLEYLGRIDQQVKVRGFRIELGEIEAVLGAHAAVGECVVLAREDAPGDKRLVAYVVARPGHMLSLPELRGALAQRLPDYMLPAAFVELVALPLTANGKVDRRALPQPRASDVPADQAPRTPVEEILAGIWGEVLGRERVGREQGFFDLGGHSLLATQVVARVRQALRVELPLRALFEAPTVAGLAERVAALQRERSSSAPPPLTRLPRAGAPPLSFAQQRLWFFDQLLPGSPLYNLPWPLRLTGALDVAALQAALREIVRRHESLHTTFVALEGEPRQVIAAPAPLDLALVDLEPWPSAEREAEARRRADADARAPFDLARGPLLRTSLLRLGSENHVLLLTMHHIVSDGWSLDVLLRELAALYDAFLHGRPSPLPEPALQYADFAQWQRSWLHGEALETPLAWWRARLAGAPASRPLPAGRARAADDGVAGAVCERVLPGALSEAARTLARREGVTPFMLTLAAFEALMLRATGQEDAVVGTPVAGRGHAELEGLIGFFVNTLVLRNDLTGRPTFRELLRRVRAATLDAYAHQDVPFEKLVEELHPERRAGRTPLFNVMFGFHDQQRAWPSLGPVQLASFETSGVTSPFDLTFYVTDLGHELALALEYRTGVFEAAEAQRLLQDYETLLEQLVSDPERRVEALAARSEPAVTRADGAPATTSPNDVAARRARLEQRRAQLSAEQQARLAQRLSAPPERAAPSLDVAPPACLVGLQPAGTRPPFFCVHPAGGDVLCYAALARHLHPQQPLFAFQAPGLYGGEAPLDGLAALARRYVDELRGRQPRGPYLLGGWSLGGAVAFEMAQRLTRAGEPVALLAIFDTVPGGIFLDPAERLDAAVFDDDARWLLAIATYAERLFGLALGLGPDDFAGLTHEAQHALFLERVTHAGWLRGAATLAHVERLVRVLKTNSRAWSVYAPEPCATRLTLFKAREPGGSAFDPTMGWGALSPQPVDVHMVPGDHVSMLAEPHVRVLAQHVQACLERAQAGAP